jgi:NAD(P)-dependent dehydrogenase (short-subunit alcohol dehydrogenase family)
MTTLQTVFETAAPVALVTGSHAVRVGRVVADRLTRLGCEVILHAHRRPETDDSDRRRLLVGAVEDEAQVGRWVEQILRWHDRLDIVVNCAAIWSPLPLESIAAEHLRRNFEVNTLGTFLLSKIAGLQMVKQPSGGGIVNLGDWATTRPYLDHAAYFPSKGAIPTLTRSLAVELGYRNPRVRVNAVLPGPVLLGQNVTEEERLALVDSTVVKRIGSASHVAHAVQFLLENDYVTGVCVPVDGGRRIFADEPTQTHHRTG